MADSLVQIEARHLAGVFRRPPQRRHALAAHAHQHHLTREAKPRCHLAIHGVPTGLLVGCAEDRIGLDGDDVESLLDQLMLGAGEVYQRRALEVVERSREHPRAAR
jgi:hypothetical protein